MRYPRTRWVAWFIGYGLSLAATVLAGCPRFAQGVSETWGSGGCDPGSEQTCSGSPSGAGGDGSCSPGVIEKCLYSGPPGTEDVGACKAGERTCKEDGSGFSGCVGEVVPAVEICKTAEDEDCGGDAPDCGALAWLKGKGDGAAQIATNVVATSSDRVVVVGQFSGKLDLGQPLAADGDDIFVVSLETSGAHLWSKTFTSSGKQGATSASPGPDGAVHVGGFFEKTLLLGNAKLTSAGGTDGFFMTLDMNGDVQLARQIRGPGDESVRAIAGDGQGGVLVTGVMTGAVDLGGAVLPGAADTDAFVARYDSKGALVWAAALSGTGPQEPAGIAVSPDGSVVVAGRFSGGLECGPQCSFPGSKDLDIFLLKMDGATGAVSWAKAFAGAGDQQAAGVDVAPDGAIVLTGSFTGSVSFDGGSSAVLNAVGSAPDLFLVKLSSEGAHQWSRSAGDAAAQEGASVHVDASGDILLGGGYWGSFDLFGVSLPPPGTSLHPFVARLDPAGAARWAVGSTGSGPGKTASVALDDAAHVLFSGDVGGPLTMSGVTVAGNGGRDAFVGLLAY